MTNAEKFMEIMNDTFDAGFTPDNLLKACSPCVILKDGMCSFLSKGSFVCKGCVEWWNKEYVESERRTANDNQ